MKRFLVASVAVAAFCSVPALAADMAVKTSPPPPPPAWSWTGFYVGGNVGWAWTDPSSSETDIIELGLPFFAPGGNFFSPASLPLSSNGVVGGAHFGYNYLFAPTWIVGVEGDWDYANLSKSGSFGPLSVSAGIGGGIVPRTSTSAQITIKDPWSIRGRFGYAQPNWMAYVTGGYAQVDVDFNGDLVCPVTVCNVAATHAPVTLGSTRSGWVAGGGVEYRLLANWIVGLEYLYYGFAGTNTAGAVFVNSAGVPTGPSGTCITGTQCEHYSFGTFNMQAVRLRLSYKF